MELGDSRNDAGGDVVDDLLSDVQDSGPRHPGGYMYQNRGSSINRKGFIVGFGVGVGGLSMSASAGGLTASESQSVFQTDFKIGYAASNTLEIYYISKVAWWDESAITLAQGLSSIAFSKYTNPRKETGMFITGGVGVSILSAPFEDGSSFSGFGAFGGIGYEFAKHWSAQADVIYSNIKDSGVSVDFVGVRLLVSGLAY